eukprot:10956870-Ditylum_brightwellii.AAC.1
MDERFPNNGDPRCFGVMGHLNVWAITVHGGKGTNRHGCTEEPKKVKACDVQQDAEGNRNVLLLWHHIVERVTPLAKVTVANLKDKIKGALLDDFGHDIKKFKRWFKDKRTMITKKIGVA